MVGRLCYVDEIQIYVQPNNAQKNRVRVFTKSIQSGVVSILEDMESMRLTRLMKEANDLEKSSQESPTTDSIDSLTTGA